MTQPGNTLFNRSCTITVGTVQVQRIGQQSGLDVWFQVRRSLKPNEVNTCDLRLMNVSTDTRKAIESAGQPMKAPQNAPGAPSIIVPVKIEAGYVGTGGTSTIFLGEMRSGGVVGDRASTVMELTTGDGDLAMILARSTKAFGPGCNAYVVAQQLLADMNMGAGNIASVASILKSSPLYSKGTVLKGSSWDHLLDLCRSCGLEVSVQHGVAQFTTLGQPLAGQAYSLDSDSGLYGDPSVDTKGVLNFESSMIPGMRPGSPIQMNAKYVQGLYRITSLETTGDTSGVDWGHKATAKKYGLAP